MPTTERERNGRAPADAAQPEDSVGHDTLRQQTLDLEQLVDEVLSERSALGPRAPDPYLGLEVDRRYVIEALIAAGGMGLVYRCRHRVLGKRLAIKIIRADVALLPDGSDRFLLEAKAASAIGHEHIVDIGDFGALPDGSPYLVMEYLEGMSLSALLRDELCLGVPRIAHLAIQIAEGLGAAHAAGIVHRDLKPDNVFVLERKGDDFIKILDFGVARMVQNVKRLTQVGTIVGTPHYMPPEQALGLEVDHRGDIYALGVILYELLAGRVPFDGEHYLSVLHQHLHSPPPAFSALRPPVIVAAALERVVRKCLAKSPAERFATMAELARELAPFRQLVPRAELEAPAAPPASFAPSAPRDALEPWPSARNGWTAERQPFGLPPPRASELPSASAAQGLLEPSRPAGPRPTAVLPVRPPTLVLPRVTGSFGVPHERVVTVLSVIVLVLVCAAAAFRLGTTRAPGIDEPMPARESARPAASRAPVVQPVAPMLPLPGPPASDSAGSRSGPSEPASANPASPASAPPSPGPIEPTPSPPPEGLAPREPPTAAAPVVPSAPASDRPSASGAAANESPRAKARPRRAPSRPSDTKRPDAPRPVPGPGTKDGFVNPWPAPRQ